MWSGTIAAIPTGWTLCNGSNGTPDLRNRFVIGAHSDNAGVANTTITGTSTLTGGSKDAIVVSHTHTIIDPGHNHTVQADNFNLFDGLRLGSTEFETGAGTITTSTNTTGISINSTGSSGTNANLPPYYALAFIMKT